MKILHKLDPSSGLAGLAIGVVLGVLAPAALTSLSLAWDWVPLSTCLALMAGAAFIQIRHPATRPTPTIIAAEGGNDVRSPVRWHSSVSEFLDECGSVDEPREVGVRERLVGQLEVDSKLARGLALCFASSIVAPGRLGERARSRLARIHAYWSGDASDLFKDDAAVPQETLAKIEIEARGILKSSAFEITALMNGLDKARSLTGVIASAEFIWVREVSPNLWHALANVGRRTVHAHCLASWSHLRAEKAAGITIAQPQLDEAVNLVMNSRNADGA